MAELLSLKSDEIHFHSLEYVIQVQKDSNIIEAPDNAANASISYVINNCAQSINKPLDESSRNVFNKIRNLLCKKALKKTSSQNRHKGNSDKISNIDNQIADSSKLSSGDIVTIEETSAIKISDLSHGMNVEIIPGRIFSIHINPPITESLNVFPRKYLLIGCPIVAVGEHNYADGANILWYRETKPSSKDYIFISSGSIYIPQPADIGCKLQVYCTPWRQNLLNPRNDTIYGRSIVKALNGVIEESPDQLNKMIEIRKQFLNRNHSNISHHIRLCTYNILSDSYANESTFPYTEEGYLNSEVRTQSILQEIIEYNADIICLQECDSIIYHNYLQPILLSSLPHRYQSHFTNKDSGVSEGCASFINRDKLIVLRCIDLPLKNILRDATYLEGFYAMRPDLRDVLGGRLGTVAQITVCRSVSSPSKLLLLANTHLYYHPAAGYLRLLQTHAILSTLRLLGEALQAGVPPGDIAIPGEDSTTSPAPTAAAKEGESTPQGNVTDGRQMEVSVIFTGDLNSIPGSAVIEYLRSGSIEASTVLQAWNQLKTFPKKQFVSSYSDEHVLSVLPTLEHSLHLTDTTCELNLSPQFTNYTADFQDVLDYVFTQSQSFSVEGMLPFPEESVLAEQTALPSTVFPSDHLAVVVDLTWKAVMS